MKKIKQITGCIVFLLICVLCVNELNHIFTPKWDDVLAPTRTFDGVYAEKDLDVVFFGSSQVICGISPMELYEAYGMKAYNCGSGSQSMINTYYWVREVVQKKHPKVVVIEVFDVAYNELDGESGVRTALDYMHPGLNKLRSAMDSSKYYDMESDLVSLMVPVARYHDRWRELESKDWSYLTEDKTFYLKGCSLETLRTELPLFPNNSTDTDDVQEESFQSEYLRKTIEYCQKNDTKVLLLKTPVAGFYPANHNLIQQIANEYGVVFVDMMEGPYWGDVGIDSVNDFNDFKHLNAWGSLKASKYMGRYLSEYYPEVLQDAERNKKDERWQQELKEYIDYREEKLSELEKTKN